MMKSKENPLVSFITLNYNQKEVTADFIKSCANLTYKNIEIIVVDNNSVEDPTEYFLGINPDIKYFRLEKNLGFTGGNNFGIEQSKGEFVFIVNNDTEVEGDMVEKLLAPFSADASIGVVSPKIKYFDNPKLIQYAGYTEINPFSGRNKTIGLQQEDDGTYDKSGYTAYAHGAAMMLKREVIEKVGAFADDFFIYYEELDWSARIVKAGYKIYYQADTYLLHKESITMGKESPIKAYYHTKNRISFMRRNFTTGQFTVFCGYFVCLVMPKDTLKYLIRGQFKHLKSFYKAIFWNLTH